MSDTKATALRAVRDETPALSDSELRKVGNDLATQAKIAAVEAVRQSMHPEFFERGKSLNIADLRRWRERAKSARKAWGEVEALTEELINEIEKNRAAARAGKQLKVVPDGSGRPGFYKAVWE